LNHAKRLAKPVRVRMLTSNEMTSATVKTPAMQLGSKRTCAGPLLLLVGLGLLAQASRSRADQDGLSVLLTRLAQAPGVAAKFREEKRIQLLSEPLLSTGSVYFTKPPALLRRVDTPEPSRMLLANGKLELWDASGKRSFELSAHPAVRSLAESFLYVLSGDRKALENLYNMRFAGSAQTAWTLLLTPKSKALAQLIREIKLAGDGIRVRSMQLTEATGDSSLTTFSDVQTDRRFSADEKRQLFATPTRP
jgi:outer membrane lipoprotein-sorting protein